jgi:hypothetical protein
MSKIRIYTNESVSTAIAEGLKRRGVDAFSARDVGNLGLTDEEQLAYARDNKAVIFTHDTDFLRLAVKWIEEKKNHYGIIYSHQKDYGVGECIRRLKLLAILLTAEDMISHIEFL